MDSWCKPVIAKSGNRVSGGAARQVRIANYENGMDDIIMEVAKDALRRADQRTRAVNIRIVKSV
jgi:hypothetical protein